MVLTANVKLHSVNFLSGRRSPEEFGSSFGSSGVYTKSEPSTPSPPHGLHALGTSAPVTSGRSPIGGPVSHLMAPSGGMFGTPPVDEGIELDETGAYFSEDTGSSKQKKVGTLK